MNTDMPWIIFHNPKAGGRFGNRRINRWRKGLLAMNYSFEWQESPSAGALIEMAAEAVSNGFRKLAVIGGDGSLNEVVNGALKPDNVKPSELILALFPAGTGNDWCRTHHIPRNPSDWLTMMTTGHTIQHDVGALHFFSENKKVKRYFINVAGLAYDGFLVKKAGQSIWQERFPFYYLLLAMSQLFQYKPQDVRVEADDKLLADDTLYTINLGICRYSGGGMSLTPHADPTDGQIALTLVRKVSKLNVLLNTWRFYTKKIGQHPKASLHHVKSLRVESTDHRPLYLEADGEFLGVAPVTCHVLKEKINILVLENT